jgi:hypothetical protein
MLAICCQLVANRPTPAAGAPKGGGGVVGDSFCRVLDPVCSGVCCVLDGAKDATASLGLLGWVGGWVGGTAATPTDCQVNSWQESQVSHCHSTSSTTR